MIVISISQTSSDKPVFNLNSHVYYEIIINILDFNGLFIGLWCPYTILNIKEVGKLLILWRWVEGVNNELAL